MKKKLKLTLITVVIALSVNAQSVKVLYKESIKPPKIEVDNPEMAEMIRSAMAGRVKNNCLYYNKGESLYCKAEDLNKDDSPSDMMESGGLKINFVESQARNYKNFSTKELVSQDYIMEKAFLISEPMDDKSWSLSDEEKIILGFKCKKATTQDGATAWYAQDIPISDGPGTTYGLPGLILQLEMPNIVITAENIQTLPDDYKIEKPTKGKKTTREKFKKTLERKMEEMGGPSDGEPTVRVKVVQR